MLWSAGFYVQIDYHRKRIRAIESRLKHAKKGAAGSSELGAKLATMRMLLASVLDNATGFYTSLLWRLATQHGLGTPLANRGRGHAASPASTGSEAGDEGLEATAARLSTRMSHHVLLSLGDIARYDEAMRPSSEHRCVAKGYYEQALRLLPSVGTPHNQLAILATYDGDDITAAYANRLPTRSPFCV